MSDESGTNPGTAIAVVDGEVSKQADALVIERRRRLVMEYRMRGYSLSSIQRVLNEKHSIDTSIATLSRDWQNQRQVFRKTFSARGFDPRVEVGIAIGRYERVMARATRDAIRAKDPRERAMLYRIIVDTQEKIIQLYETVGLIDDTIGRTLSEDAAGKKAGRIPTGEELQKRFAGVIVKDAEIVSEAEKAWLYGDAAASEQAARDTETGTPTDRGDSGKAEV